MPFTNITTDKDAHTFSIRATDAGQVDTTTLDGAGLLTVTGPNAFSTAATAIASTKVPSAGNAAQIENTYRVDGPFDTYTNGTYSVNLTGGVVADTESTPNLTGAGVVGTFDCAIFASKIPEMKAANIPAPVVVTHSSSFPTRQGWAALDGINIIVPGDSLNDHVWTTAAGQALNSWIAVDRGIEVTVSQVKIGTAGDSTHYFPTRYPQDFTIEYGSDGLAWSTATTVTSQTSWGENETRTFNFTAQTARHWRIFITANNGSANTTDIVTLEFLGN